ncbi:hypothetical protein HDV01_006460 [Terramyces sp. JEL0728]|nr:hypothetical protein HDV01_006460 [Terramyces sp. JEL0728]
MRRFAYPFRILKALHIQRLSLITGASTAIFISTRKPLEASPTFNGIPLAATFLINQCIPAFNKEFPGLEVAGSFSLGSDHNEYQESGGLGIYPTKARVLLPVYEKLKPQEEAQLGIAGIKKPPVGFLVLKGKCKVGCAQFPAKIMSSVDARFDSACKSMSMLSSLKSLPKDFPLITNTQKLSLYAYFKQAVKGSNDNPQPKWWDSVAKYKWDAWKNLGNLSQHGAKEGYIKTTIEILQAFNQTTAAQISEYKTSCKSKDELDIANKFFKGLDEAILELRLTGGIVVSLESSPEVKKIVIDVADLPASDDGVIVEDKVLELQSEIKELKGLIVGMERRIMLKIIWNWRYWLSHCIFTFFAVKVFKRIK